MNKLTTMLKDLAGGIRRHPWKTVSYIFTGFSVLFTIIRGVSHFVPGVEIKGSASLIIIILVSIGFGLWRVWKPSRVEIKINYTNTTIEVLFGDLFSQEGICAIPANEFFDSKIGRPVSDKSVHGIFINNCLGGYPESFDKQVEDQLQNADSKLVPNKIDGKQRSFPIGTSVLIPITKGHIKKYYIVFAFAKTKPETCKAYCDVMIMWVALHQLWQRVRIESGGHPINLPLVGSGLSGVGLPTRDLLNLIILSAITETKAQEITQKIRIIIHRDRFDELDLSDVKQHWKE